MRGWEHRAEWYPRRRAKNIPKGPESPYIRLRQKKRARHSLWEFPLSLLPRLVVLFMLDGVDRHGYDMIDTNEWAQDTERNHKMTSNSKFYSSNGTMLRELSGWWRNERLALAREELGMITSAVLAWRCLVLRVLSAFWLVRRHLPNRRWLF